MRKHPGIAAQERSLERRGAEEARQANRARQVEAAESASIAAGAALNDPALKAAFARVEADYIAAWRHSDPLDTAAREAAFHGLSALTKLKADLEGAAASARLTKRNLGLT